MPPWRLALLMDLEVEHPGVKHSMLKALSNVALEPLKPMALKSRAR